MIQILYRNRNSLREWREGAVVVWWTETCTLMMTIILPLDLTDKCMWLTIGVVWEMMTYMWITRNWVFGVNHPIWSQPSHRCNSIKLRSMRLVLHHEEHFEDVIISIIAFFASLDLPHSVWYDRFSQAPYGRNTCIPHIPKARESHVIYVKWMC
jgi:hypothetical protein